MKKVMITLFLVVVVILGGGGWYLFSNLNNLVKDVIVVTGTDVLQTGVQLGGVDLKLVKGSGELKRFTIKNYPGFSAPNLAVIDTIRLDIDPNSLRKDVIVIDELTISGVAINAEQKGTKTNLQALLDSLPKSEPSDDSAAEQDAKPLYFAIKKLRFTDSSINLITENYGTRSLNLPDVVQNNIGSPAKGLTAEQLGSEIVEPLIKKAKKRVKDEVKDIAKEKLKEKYGDKVDAEKAKLEEKLKDKLGDDAEAKLKGLKDLF